jgi:dihydroorotase/N-acyl-D-amino-acid deacylase
MTDQIDVLIRGAKVIDGTGSPWFYGDVAIAGERILEIARPGQIAVERAREVIEANGLVVCPGFIDILSHSHVSMMHDGRDLSKITQGVTTEILGEGWTPAPVGGQFTESMRNLSRQEKELVADWIEKARSWTRLRHWLEAMVERGVSANVGTFLGGGTLREYGMGRKMGSPTADELATMQRVMTEAMEDGAMGVSYALIYPPDTYTSTQELIEIAKVVSRYGGIYITHIRSEGARLHEALDEAIEIGQQAALPVEIYHLKASGRNNWHKMSQAIERIQAARDGGTDITADMYPYAGSGTGLTSVLPTWLAEGNKLYERLADAEVRKRVRAEVMGNVGDWERMADDLGAVGIMPVGFELPEHKQYVGKRLSEIAAMRGQDWLDAAMDVLLAEGQRIFTIYFSMDEANVSLGLKQPWVKISTDAGGVDPTWAKQRGPTHPRAYGTYPRVLGKYVHEEKLMTLEEAVRKMSGAVAARLGLKKRGLLAAGYYADVVLFDAEKITDRATFEDPHQLSEGIEEVWVNGKRVVQHGQHTGALPGQVVRGNA